MPGQVPPVADERDGLLAFLAQQRDALKIQAHGLSDEQARATPTVSALSIGGLIKHLADCELGWMDTMLQRSRPEAGGAEETPSDSDGTTSDADGATSDADRALSGDVEQRAQDYAAAFRLGEDESLADVIARYDRVAADTERIVRGIDDLGRPVPVPQDVPWFPRGVEAWSVRWVLLHLIEETARHAGHADIIRESIDGATVWPLMAAAEGWPDTPWVKRWTPAPAPDSSTR